MTTTTTITGLLAWQALDSRGNPTVGARSASKAVRAGKPSRHPGRQPDDTRQSSCATEAPPTEVAVCSARSRDCKPRWLTRSSDSTQPTRRRSTADLRELDGSAQLSRLGGNAIVSVSIAAAIATAAAHGVSLYEQELRDGEPLLPMPMINVISGGAHARGLGLDVQDFLALPVGAASFTEALEWCWRTRDAAAQLAGEAGHASTLVADEGGLGLGGITNTAAIELLSNAIEMTGLAPGDQVAIAVDVAATQLHDGELYSFDGDRVDGSTLLDTLERWCTIHPLVSLEDPLAEDDWAGWAEATRRLGDRVQLVGDDLFATNVDRLTRGIAEGVANAILVKPNQCGTLTDARAALEHAREASYATILSARSGDTEDAWLADLAVGWRAGQIKVGSTTRSERTAKWNRLLKIEAELGERGSFAGWAPPHHAAARR